jgi:hypothetical protein
MFAPKKQYSLVRSEWVTKINCELFFQEIKIEKLKMMNTMKKSADSNSKYSRLSLKRLPRDRPFLMYKWEWRITGSFFRGCYTMDRL